MSEQFRKNITCPRCGHTQRTGESPERDRCDYCGASLPGSSASAPMAGVVKRNKPSDTTTSSRSGEIVFRTGEAPEAPKNDFVFREKTRAVSRNKALEQLQSESLADLRTTADHEPYEPEATNPELDALLDGPANTGTVMGFSFRDESPAMDSSSSSLNEETFSADRELGAFQDLVEELRGEEPPPTPLRRAPIEEETEPDLRRVFQQQQPVIDDLAETSEATQRRTEEVTKIGDRDALLQRVRGIRERSEKVHDRSNDITKGPWSDKAVTRPKINIGLFQEQPQGAPGSAEGQEPKQGSGLIRLPTHTIRDSIGQGRYNIRVGETVYEDVDAEGLIALIKGGVILGAGEIAAEDGSWQPVTEHPAFQELRERMEREAHEVLERFAQRQKKAQVETQEIGAAEVERPAFEINELGAETSTDRAWGDFLDAGLSEFDETFEGALFGEESEPLEEDEIEIEVLLLEAPDVERESPPTFPGSLRADAGDEGSGLNQAPDTPIPTSLPETTSGEHAVSQPKRQPMRTRRIGAKLDFQAELEEDPSSSRDDFQTDVMPVASEEALSADARARHDMETVQGLPELPQEAYPSSVDEEPEARADAVVEEAAPVYAAPASSPSQEAAALLPQIDVEDPLLGRSKRSKGLYVVGALVLVLVLAGGGWFAAGMPGLPSDSSSTSNPGPNKTTKAVPVDKGAEAKVAPAIAAAQEALEGAWFALKLDDPKAIRAQLQKLGPKDQQTKLALLSLLRRQTPEDPKLIQEYAQAALSAGEFDQARAQALAGYAASKDDAAREGFAKIYQATLEKDPRLGPQELKQTKLSALADRVEVQEVERSLKLLFVQKGKPNYLFEPAQKDREEHWHAAIASYRLCLMLACHYEIPESKPVQIARAELEKLLGDQSDALSSVVWGRAEGGEEVVLGALMQLPSNWSSSDDKAQRLGAPVPLEYEPLWEEMLQAGDRAAMLDQKTEELWGKLKDHQSGRFYQPLLDQSGGASTRDMARGFSDAMLVDFLTNNWERIQRDDKLRGWGLRLEGGRLWSFHNSGSFRGRASRRVKSRFRSLERFSARTLAALELLPQDQLQARLFPAPDDHAELRVNVFLGQRKEALERARELKSAHGDAGATIP